MRTLHACKPLVKSVREYHCICSIVKVHLIYLEVDDGGKICPFGVKNISREKKCRFEGKMAEIKAIVHGWVLS